MIPNGYKQTEIGIIPEDWNIKKLIDLSDGGMQNGVFYETSRKGCGVFFLNVGNLYQIAPITTHNLEKFDATTNEVERFKIKHGDLFFTRSSIVPSGIAYCNWYKGNPNETTVFDSHVVRFKTDTKQVVPMYLYLQCISHSSRKYFVSNAKVATMTTIDQSQIGHCPIPIPSYVEQECIAEALSDVDSMISSLEKLIEKKKAVKQGAMQELLTGKKRLPGFTGDWVTKTVASIAEVGRGRVISHIEISKNIGGKYPVYSSQTTNNGIMGYLRTFDFDGDYITWTTDGVNAGTVFCRSGKFNCTNVCGTLKLKQNNSYFVAKRLSLETPNYVATNLANPKLMNDVMKKIAITLPPSIEEQTAIASILSDMDNEIEALEQKLEKTRQLKQGMMQQLLTGKIRLV